VKLDYNDIQHQEFKTAFRGYDPAEVRAFLEVIAENYKSLQDAEASFNSQIRNLRADNETLKGNLRSLERQLKEYQNTYSKMDRLMDAKIEADLIVEKARQEAGKLLEEAEEKIRSLDAEARFLEAQKSKAAAVLKEYLLNQLAILNLMTENTASVHAVTETPSEPVQEPPETDNPPAQIEPQATDASAPVPTESAEIRMILTDVGTDGLEIKEPTESVAIEPPADAVKPETVQTPLTMPALSGTTIQPVAVSETEEQKRAKLMQDLDKLNQQATSMFRKTDFNDMLGEEAINKSEDIINRIYAELEKKKSKKSS